VAAVTVIAREAGAAWAVFSVIYLTGLAWIASTVYYQAVTLADHPGTSLAWLAACAAALVLLYAGLRLKGRTMSVA
jgi:ferrous iron transport protein B